MFDTHSDYALNKADKSAIVCASVTGEDTRLTRGDFSSDEEFAFWKSWSDDDYHETELAGRSDDDCFSFEAQRDTAVLSAEEAYFTAYIAAEQKKRQQQMFEEAKARLTPIQFRRLWLHYVENLSLEQIADMDGVTTRRIYQSIREAKSRL